MSRPRVLTVDDDASITHLVSRKLSMAGINCDIASSAEEALEMMRRNLYFVVIADIHMPGMSGVELISAIKEISPLVQVIMLSSDAILPMVIDCADRGAIDFFCKTSDYHGLIESVGLVLARRERWAEWIGHVTQPVAAGGAA